MKSFNLKPTRVPAALITILVFAFASAQQSYESHGQIEIGVVHNRVIGPSVNGDFAWHDQYVVLPAGLASVTVTLQAADDVDLAVNMGAQMDRYSDADYLDDGDSGNASYTITNPPAGELWFDVANYWEREIPYTISVTTTGGSTQVTPPQQSSGGMVKPGMTPPQLPQVPAVPVAPAPVSLYPAGAPSGMMGRLNPGAQVYGNLDRGAERALSSYHTWTVEVPAGTRAMTIYLQPEENLFIFAKYGSEIIDYRDQAEGGDWLYGFAPDAPGQPAGFTVTDPASGTWYLDVVNGSSQSEDGRYGLIVTFE